MAGFRDIFKDSKRRVQEARRQYDARIRARVEAKRAAEAANRERQSGADPMAYSVGTAVFETGSRKRRVKGPDGAPRDETVFQTVSEAMTANHGYHEEQRRTDKILDEAAKAEYETALAHDEQLNDSAVRVFTAHGGHRATKFSRRLYRAWLAAQPHEKGTMEDPLWEQHKRRKQAEEAEAEERAAVLGGRTKKGRRRRWTTFRR